MTEIHDSTTCNCSMCQFVEQFEKKRSKSLSESSGLGNQPIGFLVPEPESGLERDYAQSSPIPATPDFDREWREAPESHRRYTEQSEAQWWLMRGVWLGIQYEREQGLVALNGDLREMQRIARERVG